MCIWGCEFKYKITPDKFAMNQHVETQLDHVPRGRPVVLHQIQCHGNM